MAGVICTATLGVLAIGGTAAGAMTRGSRCTSSQSASSATGWAVTSAIVGSVSLSTSISRARGERKATSGFSGVTTPPLSSFPVATTSSRIESAGARGEVDKSLETDRNGVRATRTVERRNAGLATPRNRGMFPPEIPLTPPEMPVTAEPMLLAMLLTGGGGATRRTHRACRWSCHNRAQ